MMDFPNSHAIVAKDPSIVSRQIVDEVILVPIRQNVGDLECIFALNEVAASIWGLIDGEKRLGEIRDALVREFDVDPKTAEADLLEFVEQLRAAEAVQIV